ncbi:PrgI family protein [Clostridium sp. Cult3]|jgi:hypothetical protein|uniref:PrgI family protein n=1 Tax=Clostridium sp. Cult3 TaxID=2079004 RepID=UPI001F239DB3|nr:PrgI family protein [Clostridium sp. Cult3]MBE6083256.1 PrgI family protein [Tissierellaceae bacterium]MCF6461755.1 PrgI family protein [Clostridium sp. Cult3]
MAFVQVPKDLSRVKTKVAFNLTKRQLICFSIGAVIGVPTYLAIRKNIGNDLALLIMIILMMPFFFTAIFEKDGIPFEKYIKYVIRQKYIYPKVRLYKTENFYEFLNSNGKEVEVEIGDRKSPSKKATKKISSKSETIK